MTVGTGLLGGAGLGATDGLAGAGRGVAVGACVGG